MATTEVVLMEIGVKVVWSIRIVLFGVLLRMHSLWEVGIYYLWWHAHSQTSPVLHCHRLHLMHVVRHWLKLRRTEILTIRHHSWWIVGVHRWWVVMTLRKLWIDGLLIVHLTSFHSWEILMAVLSSSLIVEGLARELIIYLRLYCLLRIGHFLRLHLIGDSPVERVGIVAFVLVDFCISQKPFWSMKLLLRVIPWIFFGLFGKLIRSIVQILLTQQRVAIKGIIIVTSES